MSFIILDQCPPKFSINVLRNSQSMSFIILEEEVSNSRRPIRYVFSTISSSSRLSAIPYVFPNISALNFVIFASRFETVLMAFLPWIVNQYSVSVRSAYRNRNYIKVVDGAVSQRVRPFSAKALTPGHRVETQSWCTAEAEDDEVVRVHCK